jgi:WD40 repeat protein
MKGGSNRGRGADAASSQGNQAAQVQVILDGVNVTPHSLVSSVADPNMDPMNPDDDPDRSFSATLSRSGLTSRSGDTPGDSDLEEGFDSGSGGKKSALTNDVGLKGLSKEKTEPTAEDFETLVMMQLNETPTVTMLHIPGKCVAQDTREHVDVTEKNRLYEELIEARSGSDLYVERHAQTFNFAQKNKEVMAAPPATRSTGCIATTWDIYDSYENDGDVLFEDDAAVSEKKEAAAQTQLSKQVDEVVTATLTAPGCLLDIDETGGDDAPPAAEGAEASSSITEWFKANQSDGNDALIQREAMKILGSKQMLQSLHVAERAIQQNLFHHRHLSYRDYPYPSNKHAAPPVPPVAAEAAAGSEAGEGEATAEEAADTSSASSGGGAQLDRRLEKLWSFQCDLTKGRTISCMAWNKVNKDLLAVSYGQFDFTNQRDGMVCFWSLKNPEYPERVLRMSSGVTAIDFSTSHPNMLAVGFYDGTVAIYDIRKDTDSAVLESDQGAGKHMDAVWQVQWVNKGSERGERLVSISTDGRVTEWSTKKGLSFTDLILLKRVSNPAASKGEGGEGIISRQASGLCFDFPHGESAVYLAGTEDGVIHKCSCSYNEQYLESYFGHTGPIYKIRASPFASDVFLSCSADWTAKLWDQKITEAPVLTFHSVDLKDVVHDISWSPNKSTVFGSVTGDGRIEIWDLQTSTLDPVIKYFPEQEAPEKVEAQTTEDGEGGDGEEAVAVEAEAETTEPEPVPVRRLSSILFSRNAPVLVVGDDAGSVDVYRMYGVGSDQYLSDKDQEDLLKAAMSADE